jgi:hypothetical protein
VGHDAGMVFAQRNAALVLLFGFMISGQIRLRGWTASAKCPRCRVSTADRRHYASCIGVTIVSDGPIYAPVSPENEGSRWSSAELC